MLFTSPKFILFLSTVLTLYYLTPYTLRNFVLLISSYVFYAFWDIQFVLFLIGITILTFVISILLKSLEKNKKIILTFGLMSVFLSLIFLKYVGFFNILFINFPIISEYKWVLPVGISFYTFQSASYLIDVYRDKNKYEKSIFLLALYLAFFPQLISGPISRAHKLIPQFKNHTDFNFPLAEAGVYQFIWGLFKKIVIADQLSTITNFIFNNYSTLDGFPVLIGVLAYSIQIYADFSGYSDMAIGIAKILGFELGINFKNPYLATSIKDFWSRWHISLTSWFKDYLYIPLGGNRVSYLRWVFNVLITFLVSGIWHGANITFIYWGLIHGILQVAENFIEKLFNNKVFKFKMPRLIKTIWVFILVSFAWIFFRADSYYSAIEIIKKLRLVVIPTNIGWLSSIFLSIGIDKFTMLIIIVSMLILLIVELRQYKNMPVFYDVMLNRNGVSFFAVFLIIFILLFRATNSASFIYFNF